MLNLMTQTAVMEAIPELRDSLRNSQERIHLIGVSTLSHMREHGDYRGALALINALPNGQRVQALVAWFREFTNKKLSLKQDAKTKEWKGELRKDRAATDFRVEEAADISYADFTKEAAPRTMGLTQLIGYLQRVATNTAKNDDGSPKVDEPTRLLASKLYTAGTGAIATVAQAS